MPRINKITDLPIRKFDKDIIDNAFHVNREGELYAIPLQDVFNAIIDRAKEKGVKVKYLSDHIVILDK